MTEFTPEAFEEVIVAGTQADDSYEGAELDFSGFDNFADEMACEMYSVTFASTRGGFGTLTQVKKDCKALFYFGLARKLLNVLNETEAVHSRFTTPVTRPRLVLPATFVKAIECVGDVEVDGRKFKPRDLKSLIVRCLGLAFRYGPQRSVGEYCNDTGVTDAQWASINWSLLTIDDGGDIAGTRKMDLKAKLAAIATHLLSLGDARAFTLAQRILEVSSDRELESVINTIVSQTLATRAEINALIPDVADPANNDHRNAVRALFGDAQYDGNNGSAVRAQGIRARITALFGISQKIERDMRISVNFLDVPRNEGGDVGAYAGYDDETGIVSSLVQQSMRGIGIASAFSFIVNPFGRNKRAVVVNGDVVRRGLLNRDRNV